MQVSTHVPESVVPIFGSYSELESSTSLRGTRLEVKKLKFHCRGNLTFPITFVNDCTLSIVKHWLSGFRILDGAIYEIEMHSANL
jgi:hypothetical protein